MQRYDKMLVFAPQQRRCQGYSNALGFLQLEALERL